jgi:hypothetical protein
MAKRIDRIGEQKHNNQKIIMSIIEYKNSNNINVKFEDGFIVENTTYQCFCEGTIKNPRLPFLYGLGYVGEGNYKSRDLKKQTPYYVKWFNIFERCYSDVYPSYKNTEVCEEWYNFQNFAKWYEENWKSDYMNSKWSLDKDILVKGNKIYSPETCCFIPQEINCLFPIKPKTINSNLPIGVKIKGNKYEAAIRKNNKDCYLGLFNTPEEAFQAYKVAKEQHIKELTKKWRHFLSKNVYNALINYKIEITDKYGK